MMTKKLAEKVKKVYEKQSGMKWLEAYPDEIVEITANLIKKPKSKEENVNFMDIFKEMNEELNSIAKVMKSMISDLKTIGDTTILLTQRMDIASKRLDIIEDVIMNKQIGGAG